MAFFFFFVPEGSTDDNVHASEAWIPYLTTLDAFLIYRFTLGPLGVDVWFAGSHKSLGYGTFKQ